MPERCVIDYKLQKFEAMGFEYMQALILIETRDHLGVPLYWRDVQDLVDKVGLVAAYDLLT